MLGSPLRAHYLLAHPEIEPYFGRTTLAVLTRMIGGFLVLTLVLAALGLRLRHADRGSRLYLHVVNQTWWLGFAAFAYLHGLPTTPLWAIIPFLGFFCLLLIGGRLTAAGVVSSLAAIYALTIAERLGLIPYAPFFRGFPVEGGRVAGPWLWSSMIWPAALSAVTFVVFAFLPISGKHTDGNSHEAAVRLVSGTGMELAAAPSLDVLDDVPLNLTYGSALLTRLDVYAKVVAVDGAGLVRLRFTSTPPEVLTYFEGLLES